MARKHKPLPAMLPCTCGSKDRDMENWRDIRRIATCNSCNRKVWRDTWRELIEAWNAGDRDS